MDEIYKILKAIQEEYKDYEGNYPNNIKVTVAYFLNCQNRNQRYLQRYSFKDSIILCSFHLMSRASMLNACLSQRFPFRCPRSKNVFTVFVNVQYAIHWVLTYALYSYFLHRSHKIRGLRWGTGVVMPENIQREKVSIRETEYFSEYNAILSDYFSNIGFDLTSDMQVSLIIIIIIYSLNGFLIFFLLAFYCNHSHRKIC